MARKYEERRAKPSNDAYTGMLMVSFAALLIGCGLLYLDYSQYDPKVPPAFNRQQKERPAVDAGPGRPKDTGADEPKDTSKEPVPPDDTKDTGDKKDTGKKDTPDTK